MNVKRIVGLAIASLVFAAALQGQEWKEDAKRADDYAEAGDYNAAWVFYKRALAKDCDDGLTIYRAAEALGHQTLGEDADFAKELYAVASYYLAEQNPESPLLATANSYIEDGVKRREIGQTYAELGASLPKTYDLASTRFDTVQIFIVSSFEETMQLLANLVSKGPRVTLAWTRSRMPGLLLSMLVASLLTGIILPTVMAITVGREGRKSYVSAYALLIHWGFLGIHRFYLGRYASGLLWLLTGGIFGLGVFLDLFLTGALVRFWNEDNRSGRSMRRRGGNIGGSLGYREADMRSRMPESRTSFSAPRISRRPERMTNKDFVVDGLPDISQRENPNLGSEKFSQGGD